MYACVNVRMYVCIYACMYACMYVRGPVCTYIRISRYVRTFVQIVLRRKDKRHEADLAKLGEKISHLECQLTEFKRQRIVLETETKPRTRARLS